VAVDTISLVIPTVGRQDTLAATLDSIRQLDYPRDRLEVVVVDDSGGNPSIGKLVRERLDGSFENHCVAQDRLGAATARNRGAHVASGDLVIFCDDDVVVAEDNVSRHLAKQSLGSRALVNGVSEFSPTVLAALRVTPFGRFRIALEKGYEAGADGPPLDGDCNRTKFLTARNLAVGRGLFWELGGFDEAFPYAGAEDQALSLVARRENCTLLRCHDIKVLNNEPIVTLQEFCRREERSAQTFAVLVSRFPTEAERPLYSENGPISRSDPPGRALRKAAKWILSRRPCLALLHRFVAGLERTRLAEGRLRALYAALIGLHIFRGVRTASRREAGQPSTA
jgi:glycosyltransferase involved in cell wall biosynthesis